MTQDHLQTRTFVEQSTSNKPQCVYGGFRSKCPVRSQHPAVTFVESGPARQRVARVQIEWNVQCFECPPECPVLWQVIVQDIVGGADLRESIHQRADHAKLLDAAGEFGCCRFRILHGQRSESRKTARLLTNLTSERIVGLSCDINCALTIVNRLNRGSIERQDHHFDPVLVHLPQPCVLYVEQAMAEIFPNMRTEHL